MPSEHLLCLSNALCTIEPPPTISSHFVCAGQLIPILLRIEMVEYHLAQQSWKGEGALVVSDDSGQQLLVVPIQFLRLGKVQTYAYVQQQVEAAWEQPGHLIHSNGGSALASDTASSGTLTFRRSGMWYYVPHTATRAIRSGSAAGF